LQKIKYAKFKAVDIMKAIKEGRTPVSGPPGGEVEAEEHVAISSLQPEEPNVTQAPAVQASSASV
jgi:hypothetical protein